MVFAIREPFEHGTGAQPYAVAGDRVTGPAAKDAAEVFAYRSPHLEVMRRRREWFEKTADAYLALWWVPVGDVPTVHEAEERLLHLRRHGATPYAFTFRTTFAPHGGESIIEIDDRWACPTG